MYLPFEQMPEYSRVWVYQADKPISESDEQLIRERLVSFCEGWNTHGNLMPTSFDILESQILILAVDESKLGASGCSIDSSVRTLRDLESLLQTNLTDQGKISLKRPDGELRVIPALGVKTRVTSGEIGLDAEVINPQIRVKSDLKNLWQPVRNSWLSRYFPN
ncbi:hypothetical protein J0A67_12965 [Algoriphagus aestuariicola]|jgi:hypothetical protein|uniref:ABC transporter ATPase n=1 Tax=Algoriphagus aestuariicola TaxID=1852016 RepID=A0ABS3BR71_9BACT|nr:hypothetical protein [Algoriphagus aestuariicola]MBN7801778.1 hypothetical protein [Algoriphagus aestuariicola]